jgi:anti-anti-sigma factor
MKLISTKGHSLLPVLGYGDDYAADPEPIGVTIGQKAGEAIVCLKGDASVTQARALEAGLLPVSALRPRRVILDLSEVTYLSSLAMGVLVGFRRGIIRAGGQVHLVPNLQPRVREALEAARLTELFWTAAENPSTAGMATRRLGHMPQASTEQTVAHPGIERGVINGFWLGVAVLGAAGGMLGALMPYHHPVARVISVLWWSIYCGSFGASVGALLGLRTDRCPVSSLEPAEEDITAEAGVSVFVPESPPTASPVAQKGRAVVAKHGNRQRIAS